jgi:hypothetical protein
MAAVTRRRSPEHRQECWEVYYGDIHAGTIIERVGNPHDTEQWEWRCGFYPGSLPGECQHGTAATFGQARAAFEEAWRVFLANRTEADFHEWRHARDWHEKKYAMWAAGEKLPSQKPSSLMRSMPPTGFGADRPARDGLEAAVRRSDRAAGLSPARHNEGCRRIYPRANRDVEVRECRPADAVSQIGAMEI